MNRYADMNYEKVRSSPPCIVANFQPTSSVRFGTCVMIIPIRSSANAWQSSSINIMAYRIIKLLNFVMPPRTPSPPEAFSAQLKIELIYLPAYSPNLNLIEHLWRHVEQQVLYLRYYDSFPKFQTAIRNCINGTQSSNRESLRILFSLKFQIKEKIADLEYIKYIFHLTHF